MGTLVDRLTCSTAERGGFSDQSSNSDLSFAVDARSVTTSANSQQRRFDSTDFVDVAVDIR
jgi:hypothetical protein